MTGVRLSSEAVDDLADAAVWYGERRPGLEVEFLVEVDRVLPLIVTSPASFPRLLDLPTDLVIRRALLPRFPYAVIFIDLGTEVRVLAVGPHEATARLLAESRGTLGHQGGGERPRKNGSMALREARHGTSGRYAHRRQGSMLLGSVSWAAVL